MPNVGEPDASAAAFHILDIGYLHGLTRLFHTKFRNPGNLGYQENNHKPQLLQNHDKTHEHFLGTRKTFLKPSAARKRETVASEATRASHF